MFIDDTFVLVNSSTIQEGKARPPQIAERTVGRQSEAEELGCGPESRKCVLRAGDGIEAGGSRPTPQVGALGGDFQVGGAAPHGAAQLG